MGHIQWSPLAVSEAMDQVEKEIEPIFEPLDQAYETVSKTLNRPDLPQYIRHSLRGLHMEIGNLRHQGPDHWGGRLHNAIARVRRDLPKEKLKAETKAGKPLTLDIGG